MRRCLVITWDPSEFSRLEAIKWNGSFPRTGVRFATPTSRSDPQCNYWTGSTMFAPTVTMDKINPKDCQVASPLVIQGFSNFLGLFQVIMANPDMCWTWDWRVQIQCCRLSMPGRTLRQNLLSQSRKNMVTWWWWFQRSFMFTPTWGNDTIWLIFFKWVEITT